MHSWIPGTCPQRANPKLDTPCAPRWTLQHILLAMEIGVDMHLQLEDVLEVAALGLREVHEYLEVSISDTQELSDIYISLQRAPPA